MKKLLAGLGAKIRQQQSRGTFGFATHRKVDCAVLAAVCLGLLSCTTAVPHPANCVSNTPPVQSIAATSGTPQSHAVDGAFGTPLAATVTSSGSTVTGAVVTFTAPSTGASGTFADTGKNVTTATTNASGIATPATFVANGTAGSYTVTASVSGVLTPAAFSLTNTIGAPASIIASSGGVQQATVTNAFTQPFVVTVVDVGQNPVSNAVVVFTAPSTGASGTFVDTGTNTTTVTTNASGIATSTMFTANSTAGADTVTATVGGVSTPASFNLTNAAGPPVSITATGGTPQSTATSTAFSVPLVATVADSYSNPVIGVTVTFTAPSTHGTASGTFANGKTTETDTTAVNGVATSTTFTANAVTGGPYTVTATVAGVTTAATYSLTNTVTSTTYVFYLTGQEITGPNFYALAGAVKIAANGSVLTGEQDYNDGSVIASPQPTGDSINGGTLTVDSTGQGTLTVNTTNSAVGASGIETLGVQFVNANHAQIIQFDGTATSSGSLDLQAAPSSLNGSYAFTLTGIDPSYQPIGFGGVFTISGGTTLQTGLIDTNDAGLSTVILGTPLSGTISAPDSLGRGSITGFTNPAFVSTLSLNYYVVGPEVMRLIDVDNQATSGVFTNDSAVGSAFGQGTNASGATNAALGNSAFGIENSVVGSSFFNYDVAGLLSTNSSSGTFSGVAEDNELSSLVLLTDTPISGNYSIASNGYGNLTIAPGVLGDISALGVYLTDPKLNLVDPNNTTTGLGGAVVADMDAVSASTGAVPAGGTGILIPTDTSAPFAGTYTFGARGINYPIYEFDFVGVGPVTGGTLNGTGILDDIFLAFGFNPTDTGVTFSGTPQADPSNPGRYTMLSTNTGPNPLTIAIGGTVLPGPYDVVMYQGSGGQLFWIDEDFGYGFLGMLEQQGSLIGLPAARVGTTKKSNAIRQSPRRVTGQTSPPGRRKNQDLP